MHLQSIHSMVNNLEIDIIIGYVCVIMSMKATWGFCMGISNGLVLHGLNGLDGPKYIFYELQAI